MEKKLYEILDIAPLMLSKCSYENLSRLRIEEGADVCIHMDVESFNCEECEYTQRKVPFYPPLSNDIYMWIASSVLSNVKTREYVCVKDFKDEILDRAIEWAESDETVKKQLREAILGYYQYQYPTLK